MSLGINNNPGQKPNFADDFEILDKPDGKPTQAESPRKAGDGDYEIIGDDEIGQLAGEAKEIDGPAAMKGAKVQALAEELRAAVPARHTVGKRFANYFKSIGRDIMKFCHAIRNGFAFAPAKKSRGVLEAALEAKKPNAYFHDISFVHEERPEGEFCPNVKYATEEIAAGMGLRGRITAVPFTDDEIKAIKDGKYKLTDIKQDPNFQDCWFLSSLASFLTAKGPGAIQDLINIPPDYRNRDGVRMAQVKLGGEVYDVPLAKIYDIGGHGASFSKPWVKLLETAMQMHLMNLHRQKATFGGPVIKADMCNYDARIALAALSGEKISEDPLLGKVLNTGFGLFLNVQKQDIPALVASIKSALDKGEPVVLGSPKGLWNSLGNGISPGHEVSIQDVAVKKNGTAYFIVFDPYGRTVSISSDILLDNGAAITMKEEPAQRNAASASQRSRTDLMAEIEAEANKTEDDW